MMQQRETMIFKNANYMPLHPEIFTFHQKFLAPSFLQACNDAAALKPLMQEVLELQKTWMKLIIHKNLFLFNNP